jgi:hypothetical protein
MQTEAPRPLDISKESDATKKLYGLDQPKHATSDGNANGAALAQRDVRFIQISHEYRAGTRLAGMHAELIRLHTRGAAGRPANPWTAD